MITYTVMRAPESSAQYALTEINEQNKQTTTFFSLGINKSIIEVLRKHKMCQDFKTNQNIITRLECIPIVCVI